MTRKAAVLCLVAIAFVAVDVVVIMKQVGATKAGQEGSPSATNTASTGPADAQSVRVAAGETEEGSVRGSRQLSGTANERESTRIKASEEAAANAATAKQQAQWRELTNWLAQVEQYSQGVHGQFQELREKARQSGTHEGEIARELFAPMRERFQELGRLAATNDLALRALMDAAKRPLLQGPAVQSIGLAAEKGNEEALRALLDHQDHGWLLSSAAGALRNIAANGEPRSIHFMYEISTDPKKAALWFQAAEGLRNPAGQGNEEAIAGLVNLSGSGNESVRRTVLTGLTQAAAQGSVAAENAIRDMNAARAARPAARGGSEIRGGNGTANERE